jgi:mono/diheme cytochrome c family protein
MTTAARGSLFLDPFARRTRRGAAATCAILIIWGSPAGRGQEDRGRQVYAKAGCETCHGTEGKGADAPALASMRRPYPEFVKIVREGMGEMPPHSKDEVSDAELDTIYRWLVQLPSKRNARVTTKPACRIAHDRRPG